MAGQPTRISVGRMRPGGPIVMNLKKKLKRYSRPFKYTAARWGVLLARSLAKKLPVKAMIALFQTMALFSRPFQWRTRSQMLANLRVAFGSEMERNGKAPAIVSQVFKNVHRGTAELVCSPHWTAEFVKRTISLEGREHLDRALASGRGAIALSAHIGNFTLLGTRLAVEGYSFNALVKNPPDRKFAELLNSVRLQMGQKTIPARPRVEAAKSILKALKKNEIVLMIADEYKHDGITVEFFGREAPSARGPATLALRSKAAVIPMFLLWEEEGLRLIIEPQLDLVETGQPLKDIQANTAMFARCVERVIRQYPDQWNWLNLRWGKNQTR